MSDIADPQMLREHGFRWVDQSYGEGEELAGRKLAAGYDAQTAAKIAELGWFGVMVAADKGGIGGGLPEMVAVMEAVGRGLVAEPVLSQGGIAAPLLDRLGTADADALLARLVDGTSTAVLLHNEADAGFERTLSTSRIEPDGNGYRLTAAKAPTLDAAGASTLLVTALHPDGRMAVVALDAGADGLRRTTFRSVDGRALARFDLDNIKVSAEAIVSGPSDATRHVERVLDEASILVCAEAVGAMAVLVEQTSDYLRTRRQFGTALSSFQVLQHRMVDMLLASEEASAVVEAALDAAGGPGRQRAFALAKIVTARSARFVAQQAVQLHGGIGMTDELKVSRYFRRLMQCETLFGDADWHAERFDRMRG